MDKQHNGTAHAATSQRLKHATMIRRVAFISSVLITYRQAYTPRGEAKDIMTSSMRRGVTLIVASATLAIAGGTGSESVRAVAPKADQVTLGVAGLSNATPSLAVTGSTIAAVWTAGKGGIVDAYAAMSIDGGSSFSEPRRVNDQPGEVSANNEQPPRVVIAGSGTARIVTVIWSKRSDPAQKARQDVIRIAQSSDGGRTFSPARTIHDSKLSGARGWESLTTGPGGAVHAVWLDGRDADAKMSEAMATKRQPWQEVYHATFTPDGHIVESQIASGVCFCCKTAVAVDGRGTVYAAWRHIFPGSIRDIAFASSSDGGLHFGPLVRVSEDKWEINGCPEDGPAMGVENSGRIHIAWPTLVSEGEPQKALFYATSVDGKAFSPRARVPTAGVTNPSHPQLTLTADGGSAIVWDEVLDGVRRVSMSRVSPAGVFSRPQVLSGSEPGSFPVTVRQPDGGYLVAWTNKSSPDQSMISLKRISAR
jgi:hypothetical protein